MSSQERWTLSSHGPTRLWSGSTEVSLRPKERAVIAALVFRSGATTSVSDIAELVWGAEIPATYKKTIQNHVARIRKAAPGLIETADAGYRLSLHVDVVAEESDGEAFADLAEHPDVKARRRLLEQQADQLADAHLQAAVDRGDPEARDLLLAAVAQRPLNELRHGLLIRLLARAGLQRDALMAIAHARRLFREVGLPVGETVADLERRLLDGDPTLLAPRPHRGREARMARPPERNDHIVGRQHYLDIVRPQLLGAEETAVVSLVGPAGSGKTTIAGVIRDFAEDHGFTSFSVTCRAQPSVALEPIRDLLSQMFERYPDELRASSGSAVLGALEPALTWDGSSAPSDRIDRESLFEAITAAIRCAPRPTLVVVEDLHRASPGTRELFERCRTRRSDNRLVMVETSRTDATAPDELPAGAIRIRPWGPAEVALYVARFGQNDGWTADAANWIFEQTDGVALHVRELTLEVLNQPSFDGDHFEPPSTVPENLGAHLDRQLRRLSPHAMGVLQAIATVGPQCDVATLEHMVSTPDVGLAEACRSGVLRAVDARAFAREALAEGAVGEEAVGPGTVGPGAVGDGAVGEGGGGVYEFRHDLFRLAVQEMTPAGVRVELHDLAARALAASGRRPVEVARHALAAVGLDAPRATNAALLAAHEYGARFQYEEAAELALRAHELAPAGGRTWCEATVLAGNMWMRLGDQRALEFLRAGATAAIELGDQALIADAISELCRLGLSSAVTDIDPETRELLRAALEATTDDMPRALTATAAAQLYSTSGQPETCRAYFEEAVRCARLAGDPATVANALGTAVISMHEPSDLALRKRSADELDEIAAATESAEIRWSANLLRLSDEVQLGDPHMRVTLADLEALAVTLRQRTRTWELTYWQANVALVDGDLELAERRADETLTFGDALSDSLLTASYGGLVLAIRCAQGRAGELHDTVCALVRDQPAIGAWVAAQAFTAAATGDVAGAQAAVGRITADSCGALSRDFTFSGALSLLGRAAAWVGDREACATVASLLEPWAARWAWAGTATFGPIDLVRARLAHALGDAPLARLLAEGAVAQCERAEAPLFRAEAAEVLADL